MFWIVALGAGVLSGIAVQELLVRSSWAQMRFPLPDSEANRLRSELEGGSGCEDCDSRIYRNRYDYLKGQYIRQRVAWISVLAGLLVAGVLLGLGASE